MTQTSAKIPQTNSDNQRPKEAVPPEKTTRHANEPNSAAPQSESNKPAAKRTVSGLEQDIEKVLLGAGYPQNVRADVKDAVSSGISETNPLSSVHTKLQHTAKDFTAIYKLIKPAVSEYLCSAAKRVKNIAEALVLLALG